MLDWLNRKKSVTRPHSISVQQYVEDGWQANVDNSVCDVFIWDKNYGWLNVIDISAKRHSFVREAYRLSFSNLEGALDFYPAMHKTRLQIVYHDSKD